MNIPQRHAVSLQPVSIEVAQSLTMIIFSFRGDGKNFVKSGRLMVPQYPLSKNKMGS